MKPQDVMEQDKREKRELGLFLSTHTGRKLMASLEREFDPDDITGKTNEETYFNIGARHVYRVLKRLRDDAQKEQ